MYIILGSGQFVFLKRKKIALDIHTVHRPVESSEKERVENSASALGSLFFYATFVCIY